jgi:hypothetical protein
MTKLQVVAISLIFFTAACGSQKELVQEPEAAPKPGWVNGKPIENGYYAGIGTATKSSGADYASIAKNNALNDLASEISVNVSSNSLFYQIEQDDNLREEFQANTRLNSKENLEGYELVGTWEDENQYWIYYRLNKYVYEEIKQKRLNKAVAFSKQLFSKAETFRDAGQYAESLKFGVKAIGALKEHMADPIQTEWQGRDVFLLVELYTFMQQTLGELNLQPVFDEITVKRGEALSAHQLSFLVTGSNGQPVSNLPIYLYYSGKRIKNNQLYTGNNGTVSYTLSRVSSTNKMEYVQANLNMVSLVSEATDDAFIRKLLAKLSGPEARIEIGIEKPAIGIVSSEKNGGQEMQTLLLANAFKQNFINQGFEILDEAKADYVLYIQAEARNGNRQGKFYTSAVDATFQFKNSQGALLYEKQVQGFMGMQLDQIRAGEDAYRKLANEINKRYFRELRRQVFD